MIIIRNCQKNVNFLSSFWFFKVKICKNVGILRSKFGGFFYTLPWVRHYNANSNDKRRRRRTKAHQSKWKLPVNCRDRRTASVAHGTQQMGLSQSVISQWESSQWPLMMELIKAYLLSPSLRLLINFPRRAANAPALMLRPSLPPISITSLIILVSND